MRLIACLRGRKLFGLPRTLVLRTHFWSFTEVVRKIGARLRESLASEVLFCFPALRFDVFSPQRDGRYRGAPKPWKEKQKGYNYCSAIWRFSLVAEDCAGPVSCVRDLYDCNCL